jgi:hypothetical protein
VSRVFNVSRRWQRGPKDPPLRVRRHNKKVDIVFRVTEFYFRLEGYAQMLTHLPHNIRETIISEIAVKIE